MGNLHSSWLHRQRESATQTPSERNNSRSRSSTSIARGQQLSEPVISNSHNFNSNNTTEETVQSSLPYELRRTVARLRRRGTTFREGSHTASSNLNGSNQSPYTSRLSESVNATSTTSLSSTSSRRRIREADDSMDFSEENNARRPRVEALSRGDNFPTDLEDQGGGASLFFYFALPSENGNSRGTLDSTSINSIPENSQRRRSSRLQQAADYLRERFSRNSQHHHHPPSRSTPDYQPQEEPSGFSTFAFPPTSIIHPSSSSTPETVQQQQQQMVLVRIRQLPISEPPTASTPPAYESSIPTNDPEAAAAAPTTTTTSTDTGNNNSESIGGNVRSVFQWTIYFVMPRSESPSSPSTTAIPSTFDANMAVQRAFTVLRAIMSGENMNYEDWARLQEMMGFVSRGVTKDQVEAQCAAKTFSISLNIGSSCPICLSDYQAEDSVRTLPCTHSYHTDCIDTWLGSCNNCPLCRQPPVIV